MSEPRIIPGADLLDWSLAAPPQPPRHLSAVSYTEGGPHSFGAQPVSRQVMPKLPPTVPANVSGALPAGHKLTACW